MVLMLMLMMVVLTMLEIDTERQPTMPWPACQSLSHNLRDPSYRNVVAMIGLSASNDITIG